MQVLNEMAGGDLSKDQLQLIVDNLKPTDGLHPENLEHPKIDEAIQDEYNKQQQERIQKYPRILIKKKLRLGEAVRLYSNVVNTGKKTYYFMPCYFTEHGAFDLEVVPLDNPPQDLIDYLNKRREGEKEQQ